jgi:hypothetical protein
MSMPPERYLTLYQRASSGYKTSSGRRVAVTKPAAGASTRNTSGRDGGCAARCSSAIRCLRSPALQQITGTPVVVAQALTRRANRPTNHQVRVVQIIIEARRAAAATRP